MKSIVMVLALASFAAGSASAAGDPVKEYAQLLHHGAFMCKVQQGTYDNAVRYQSATQAQASDKVMACYKDFSTQAKAGLPGAIKAAKNESTKQAIKTLYTDWNSYFGEFDRISESRYERSENALYTELMLEQ